MKRLLIYLSCFLVVGGGGTLLQSCEALEIPGKKSLTITKDLVAYLPFTSGSLEDIITKGDTRKTRNNAIWWTNSTPTFTEDFTGTKGGANSAISFNGTSDYITLKDDSTLRFKTSFSISLWIRPDVKQFKPGGAMQIYHKSVNANPSINESYSALIRLSNIFYTVTQKADKPDQTVFLIRSNIKMQGNSDCKTGQGWQEGQFVVNPTVLTDSWHHIVFTYNESDGTSYLDGNLVNTFKLTGGPIQSCPGGDLRFGMQFKGAEDYFKGAMDEIRIYSKQLKEEEVRALFELKTI
ncbi:MAG: LamG domain-containing protein [Pedobacter sp.]|nr:MAG: LamG domain-containing protein [Pedobacter sp.]